MVQAGSTAFGARGGVDGPSDVVNLRPSEPEKLFQPHTPGERPFINNRCAETGFLLIGMALRLLLCQCPHRDYSFWPAFVPAIFLF